MFHTLFCAVLLSSLSPNMPQTNSVTIDSTALTIEEVVVTAPHRHHATIESLSSVDVESSLFTEQIQASLAQGLSSIAGVQATSIGSGNAKPIIRGLGLNRIAVIHDGIRHEGQQWGRDHGLEIDPLSIDHIAIIKGASALLYGSDAIGGVLLLSSPALPKRTIGGKVQLYTRTNNELFGVSAMVEAKKKAFYYRAHVHYKDYGDYHVPADSFEYYSYRIPLYKRSLRNTAGREINAALALGYTTTNWHTCLRLYENYSKSGFFANAHGLEVRLSSIDYDRSQRDIDLPYQSVNHFKAILHSTFTHDHWSMELNAAWQNNLRREFAEPISHGYMPTPPDSLERQLNKHTATLHALAQWHVAPHHLLRFGMQTEMQHNRRSGWGFILPDFEQYTAGVYASEQWSVNKALSLFAGLRYDFAHIRIHSYQDWYPTPIADSLVYQQRSTNQARFFHSLTWSLGIRYAQNGWDIKANIGKAFRMPTAKELGADGINYHIFRYEEGNANLQPEQSYQADLSIAWSNQQWRIQCDPFLGYFPNYIYLSPNSTYREGLQLYTYAQNKVLRAGAEVMLRYRPWEHLELNLQGEYLFARQLSGDKAGYGLPFAPPWRIMPELKFLWTPKVQQDTWSGYAGIDVRLCGAQRDIVPPEKPTPGWWTLNLSAGQTFVLPTCQLQLGLKADNILNTRYYDHTSYYRLIDIPEPGWNVAIQIGISF